MRFLSVFLILILLCFGCSQEDTRSVDDADVIALDTGSEHFDVIFEEGAKSIPALDSPLKRDAYREKSLNDLESLYSDFQKRFGFAPKHKVNITISDTDHGAKNVAHTTIEWRGNEIVNLSMLFPYAMFERKEVRAHEMTHAFLSRFMFPTWVDEGFAVLVENSYTDTPNHPHFTVDEMLENIRRDANGVNAIQHWTEGQGIYADPDLTEWCYRYSYSIIGFIENTHPEAIAKVLSHKPDPKDQFSTKAFVKLLDKILPDENMPVFFQRIGFQL